MELPELKSLDSIFAIANSTEMAFELRRYCAAKERKQPLTRAEHIFDCLARFGGRIAGDGFVSLFHEFFSPKSFSDFCDALEEIGAIKLRNLFCEAWSIYTKDKQQISVDELQSISVRRFNTKDNMNRFDQIGEEVVAEIQAQYTNGKIWSVEYAKLHRDQFEPIRE